MEELPKQENKESLDIKLRKAGLADINTLIEIEKSVSASRTYSPMLGKMEWLQEMMKGLKQFGSKIYIIEIDGVPVGNIAYDIKSENEAYIAGLVTKSEFQGRGVGRKALELALEELKDFKRISLVTHPNNENALKLYQSLGFVIEAQKENYYGDGEPRVVMVLEKK